jgi:hypothetical protein
MTQRMLIALGAAFLSVGTSFAQTPVERPLVPVPSTEKPTSPPVPVFPDCGAAAPSGSQFWADADYLLGWMEDAHLPPLVTTSPAGTARASAGVVGAPHTGLLFAGSVNDDLRSGIRFAAGYWFDPEQTFGVRGDVRFLESQATLFSAISNGSVILARPFTNTLTNTPQSVLIAFPGSSAGEVDSRAYSGALYQTHLDLTAKLCDPCWARLDTIFGYGFFRYDEGLGVRQTIAPTSGNFAAGTHILTVDDFNTRNEFHGADFGLRARFTWENLTLDCLAQGTVGAIYQQVDIAGGQRTAVPGSAPVTNVGGVLALATNSGLHHHQDWAVLPEFGATLSWQYSSNVCVRLGYSLFGLDRVARAGDQVDTFVNPNLFPGQGQVPSTTGRPAFILNRTEVWVQTLNLGIEYTF